MLQYFLCVLMYISLVFASSAQAIENKYTGNSEDYQKIILLPEDNFGWYGNSSQIEEIFRENDINIVVEVGSWLGGGSTQHFAKLVMPKKGIVYSIDTWLGNKTPQIEHVTDDKILPKAYQQFLSNMIHWGYESIVVPIKKTSLDASQIVNLSPDLVYIDANHSFDSVYQDLTVWYPHIKNHGILCGDDWPCIGVQSAVKKFADENGLRVSYSGAFWVLE